MENKAPSSFSLNMVSPCTKNWEKMTATEKGRFCKSCNKEVVNLVGLDEKEMTKILFEQPNHFCGRVEAKHLNSIKLRKRSWFNKAASSIILALGLTSFFTKNANAQVIDLSKPNSDSLKQVDIRPDSAFHKYDKIKIEGTIRDKKTGEIIPFADIVCKSSENIVGESLADQNGNFIFEVDDSTIKSIDIGVGVLGYKELFVNNVPLSYSIFANLTLKQDPNARIQIDTVVMGKALIVNPNSVQKK